MPGNLRKYSWQPIQKPPKGGAKTRFWSTHHSSSCFFYVRGTWRRIADFGSPQPPSPSCELLIHHDSRAIHIANFSRRRNDSNSAELLTEVLIPKYPGQTALGRLKVTPWKGRTISLKDNLCLKSYRQQIDILKISLCYFTCLFVSWSF